MMDTTIDERARALMAQFPELARDSRGASDRGRANRAAAREAAASAALARAAESHAADVARETAADDWRIAASEHGRALRGERDAIRARFAKALHEYADALTVEERGGLTPRAWIKSARATRVEPCDPVTCPLCALRSELSDIRARIAHAYAAPLTAGDLATGGTMHRSALWHGYSIARGADEEDVVAMAALRAVERVYAGQAVAYDGSTGRAARARRALPDAGAVRLGLRTVWREEVDAYRQAVSAGLSRVYSLEELAELESIDGGAVESIERYGFAYVDGGTRSIWEDIAAATEWQDVADAQADVARLTRELARARKDGRPVARFERELAAAETRAHMLTVNAAREVNAADTRAARIAATDTASTFARVSGRMTGRVARALFCIREIAGGATLTALADTFGVRVETIVADAKEAAPVFRLIGVGA